MNGNGRIPHKEDRYIVCVDCGDEFVFTAGEILYFESKQLSEPKRCPACRKQRRLSIVPDQGARGGW